MEESTRLDEVTVFGGKLSFLVPHDWEETAEENAEENFYSYSEPGAESGWLRVSLNTVKAVRESPAEILSRIFEGRRNVTENEQTGNWVCAYEKDSEKDGVRIHLYYWIVAKAVETDLVREAIFSYTVLTERANGTETRKVV